MDSESIVILMKRLITLKAKDKAEIAALLLNECSLDQDAMKAFDDAISLPAWDKMVNWQPPIGEATPVEVKHSGDQSWKGPAGETSVMSSKSTPSSTSTKGKSDQKSDAPK